MGLKQDQHVHVSRSILRFLCREKPACVSHRKRKKHGLLTHQICDRIVTQKPTKEGKYPCRLLKPQCCTRVSIGRCEIRGRNQCKSHLHCGKNTNVNQISSGTLARTILQQDSFWGRLTEAKNQVRRKSSRPPTLSRSISADVGYDLLTEHEKSQRIVVRRCICSIGGLNAKQRRDDSTEATIEKSECGENGIRIRVSQDKFPLR